MKTKNRIACIFNYAPHYRRAIYHLMAKELDCDFFFGANLLSGESLEKMELSCLPGFRKESKVLKLYRYEWQRDVVRQAFKRYQIYILTGSPALSNIVFMLFARLFGKRVFLWTHGLKSLEDGKNPLVRFFFRSAAGYFMYGNYGRTIMLTYGIPEDRLFVINNSLDYERQIEVRKGLSLTSLYADRFRNNNPVVIFSGRLLKGKKIEMILEAQSLLLGECPFNFVLVGDGPEQESLQRRADELGLAERVWFYGACYEEETLGSLFYNAALTVSPGNVGLTAIHSMMYGTPVLTHDNAAHQGPEHEAIIPGETGSFFSENDVLDLTHQIKCWFTDCQDRENILRKCFRVIDGCYNPYYALKVMKQVIAGS